MFTKPTTSAPARKFLFEKSFDDATEIHRAKVPERKPVTLKPEQIDELKQQSYEEGMLAGQKAAAEDSYNRLNILLEKVDGAMAQLAESLQSIHESRVQDTRCTVLAIAKKILSDFVARNGVQEITAVLDEAIADMIHEPRLVVRLSESEFDEVNAKIQDISKQKAYAGHIVVLADADIIAGDCRVEWADGGVERTTKDIWTKVETTLVPETNQSQE